MSETKNICLPAWEDLTFANNFLFCKILESEPEICRRLLEMLLHIEIERIETPQIEKTIFENPDSKSVRFDVYVRNEDRIFDVEMQTAPKKWLPKRSRYYQGAIDMNSLSPGESYSKMKESYVIFLCLSDPFDENLPVYFFENVCRDGKKRKLNDGAFKLFFNASEYAKIKDVEERCFFRFLSERRAESDFTKSIEEKVTFATKNREWKRQYMIWSQLVHEEREFAFEEGIEQGLERGRELGVELGREQGLEEGLKQGLKQGIEEGLKQGIEEGLGQGKYAARVETAKNLLKMKICTYNQIAEVTNLSLEDIERISEELS